MIYVIYVQSGREHDVVATLRDKNINAYAPAHDLLERKGGVWRMVRRMIFPTYVFVNSEGITDELYYTVKNTVGVLRFLGRPPTPLPMSEEVRLRWILSISAKRTKTTVNTVVFFCIHDFYTIVFNIFTARSSSRG